MRRLWHFFKKALLLLWEHYDKVLLWISITVGIPLIYLVVEALITGDLFNFLLEKLEEWYIYFYYLGGLQDLIDFFLYLYKAVCETLKKWLECCSGVHKEGIIKSFIKFLKSV